MSALLGAADVRALAARYDVRPTRQRGQNFVIDPNTVRRIVAAAELTRADVVLEVGPGLGSLTLGLLPHVSHVTAVEIEQTLANGLPETVAEYAPGEIGKLRVIEADALRLRSLPDPLPNRLVANLPYNVAVPVLLHLLERFCSITAVLVMVQSEVADRLTAAPGTKSYGVPTLKASWYCDIRTAGPIGRQVFWPAPNVDSGLVAMVRREPPTSVVGRARVFEVIDAALGQRRKMIRSALADLAGSSSAVESAARKAGIDPQIRGERLDIGQFARLADAIGPAT